MTITDLRAELHAANDLIDIGNRALFAVQNQRDEWRDKYRALLIENEKLQRSLEAQS